MDDTTLPETEGSLAPVLQNPVFVTVTAYTQTWKNKLSGVLDTETSVIKFVDTRLGYEFCSSIQMKVSGFDLSIFIFRVVLTLLTLLNTLRKHPNFFFVKKQLHE